MFATDVDVQLSMPPPQHRHVTNRLAFLFRRVLVADPPPLRLSPRNAHRQPPRLPPPVLESARLASFRNHPPAAVTSPLSLWKSLAKDAHWKSPRLPPLPSDAKIISQSSEQLPKFRCSSYMPLRDATKTSGPPKNQWDMSGVCVYSFLPRPPSVRSERKGD
jgi:hypothetical protein